MTDRVQAEYDQQYSNNINGVKRLRIILFMC